MLQCLVDLETSVEVVHIHQHVRHLRLLGVFFLLMFCYFSSVCVHGGVVSISSLNNNKSNSVSNSGIKKYVVLNPFDSMKNENILFSGGKILLYYIFQSWNCRNQPIP